MWKIPFFDTEAPCSSFPIPKDIYFDETSPSGNVHVSFSCDQEIESIQYMFMHINKTTKYNLMSSVCFVTISGEGGVEEKND